MTYQDDWAGIEFCKISPLSADSLHVEALATGWSNQLARRLDIALQATDVVPFSIECLSIRLHSKLPATVGFAFPEAIEFVAPSTDAAGSAPSPSGQRSRQSGAVPPSAGASADNPPGRSSSSDKPAGQNSPDGNSLGGSSSAGNSSGKDSGTAASGKRTRIAPPADLVKLEDRLYFVLQPPLETLLDSAELRFPFEPFPYQMEGIAFLFPRETAILADEMGLGKTMQAITTIRMLLMSGHLRSVLLVCPKPLVTNWVREFRQWAPEIPVAVVEGDAAKRNWIWQQHDAPVRIANYELLMRDKAILDDPDAHFDLVVLDEAQRIKNRNSTTAQIVRALPRGRSWALTGTPIENSVEDLINIFEFLSPGYLRSEMSLKNIGLATRDHILRRTKDKVLTEMPGKMYRDEELELTSAQYNSYRTAEDEGVVQLSEMGETLTIQHVFELVLRLKQICNFDPSSGSSCKLERLEADMEEIAASGQKAIVFSQWVETLEKISQPLQRFGPMHYHGRVPSKKRDGVIAQFKEDPSKHLILMSYGAGSVGLNLQFCHYVFLFDRWWNPAVEDQAINRAHRIGVTAPVTVTRMMAADTIEQRIHEVLEQKRELFNQLFAEAGPPRSMGLSQEDIFGLFNLSTPKPVKHAA